MLSHFFVEEGSFKLANIQRWPCILLSVGFTLHKIDFFYVLNMLNFYISRWKNDHTPMDHAGYNEGYYTSREFPIQNFHRRTTDIL